MKDNAQSALFLGTATVDIFTKPSVNSTPIPSSDKTEAKIEVQLGGCPVHAARAFRLASGFEPHLFAILGHDHLGDCAALMVRDEFRHFRVLRTTRATRISVNWPGDAGNDCSGTTFTTRSSVDGDRTLTGLANVLACSPQLLVGPMTASDTPWLHEVLRRFSKNADGRSFLLLSREQMRDQEAAVRLCRRADYVVLNRAEASMLAGTSLSADVPALNSRFCDLDIRRVIVTDGAAGVHAFVDGVATFEPALQVSSQNAVGAGDTFVGTLMAGLIHGRSLHDSMRLAGAASALHVSNSQRRGGWPELEEFFREKNSSHSYGSSDANESTPPPVRQ